MGGGGREGEPPGFLVASLKRSTILAPFTVSLLQINNLNVSYNDSLKVNKQYTLFVSPKSGDTISLFSYEK